MDIARVIAIQFNIANAAYILIGVIVLFGAVYFYGEYQEHKRKRSYTTNKRTWL